jgi:hypothetical protein
MDDDDDDGLDLNKAPKETTLLLSDIVDSESTSKHIVMQPCPICLNDYYQGEILCWSQNSNCTHCFHRDCMEEWLLRNEECPCCRENYLSLDRDENDDDDEELAGTGRPSIFLGQHRYPSQQQQQQQQQRGATATAEGEMPDESSAFMRGIHLFYLLSRLQSLADTRPNTTIRLEGVELANGRTGSLEIQRATNDSSILEFGARGLNVRVTSDDDGGDIEEATEAEGERNHTNDDTDDTASVRLDLPVTVQPPEHQSSNAGTSQREATTIQPATEDADPRTLQPDPS